MTIRRVIAILSAVVFASVAAGLVLVYTQSSDERAMADLSPTNVYVVTQTVPEGTAGESIAEYVEVRQVPGNSVVPGNVADLANLKGKVAVTALLAGEQLLEARFEVPVQEVEAPAFEVPAGMHQLTIELSATRVLGGHLKEGDTVGVFVSITSPVEESEGEEATSDEEKSLGQTHLTLHKVLVTKVEGGFREVENEEGETETQEAEGTVFVTVALAAPDAEKLVFASEYGTVWLSLEPADAAEDGTRPVNQENVYS